MYTVKCKLCVFINTTIVYTDCIHAYTYPALACTKYTHKHTFTYIKKSAHTFSIFQVLFKVFLFKTTLKPKTSFTFPNAVSKVFLTEKYISNICKYPVTSVRVNNLHFITGKGIRYSGKRLKVIECFQSKISLIGFCLSKKPAPVVKMNKNGNMISMVLSSFPTKN